MTPPKIQIHNLNIPELMSRNVAETKDVGSRGFGALRLCDLIDASRNIERTIFYVFFFFGGVGGRKLKADRLINCCRMGFRFFPFLFLNYDVGEPVSDAVFVTGKFDNGSGTLTQIRSTSCGDINCSAITSIFCTTNGSWITR